MKLPHNIKVYGDTTWRGVCPTESVEQKMFFKHLRSQYPKTYGLIAIHPRNEGNRMHAQTTSHRAQGMTTGAADIIIPGNPSFVCEMKRRDHKKSVLQDTQIEYLTACQDAGAFVCVALGYENAWAAFNDWRQVNS